PHPRAPGGGTGPGAPPGPLSQYRDDARHFRGARLPGDGAGRGIRAHGALRGDRHRRARRDPRDPLPGGEAGRAARGVRRASHDAGHPRASGAAAAPARALPGVDVGRAPARHFHALTPAGARGALAASRLPAVLALLRGEAVAADGRAYETPRGAGRAREEPRGRRGVWSCAAQGPAPAPAQEATHRVVSAGPFDSAAGRRRAATARGALTSYDRLQDFANGPPFIGQMPLALADLARRQVAGGSS